MSEPTEEERTDPHISLPDRASGPPSDRASDRAPEERTMEVELPDAAPPPLPGRSQSAQAQSAQAQSAQAQSAQAQSAQAQSAQAQPASPPPGAGAPKAADRPSQPAARPRAPFPPAGRTSSAFPPAGRIPSSRVPSGVPGARAPSAFPPADPSRSPVPIRQGTIPPSRMPKPSDPPPPRASASPPERQRIAQMETQLDQTRSAIARQKNELDELRARLEEKEQRLDALLGRLAGPDAAPAGGADPELDRRLRELELKKEDIARELRVRFSAQEEDTEKHVALLDTLSNRLQWLEEGEESARIRMRLENVGHRLTALESKLVEVAESQDDLREEALTREVRDGKQQARIERLESLFDEMADELRTRRDGSDLEALRARLEGVETLVLETGNAEQALKLEVEALRGSMAPPSAGRSETGRSETGRSETGGDDLTRIRGIGPKFARQLEGLGVTSFAQIAAWGADDVERIATELGIKASRIAKAGWVKSARALVG